MRCAIARTALSIVPSAGSRTDSYAASAARAKAAETRIGSISSPGREASSSAAPRTICERITPLLPRAPSSAARATAVTSSSRPISSIIWPLMWSSSASTARIVIAMLSPVSPSATGKTLRSFTSARRLSSSAHAVATALRKRTMEGSDTATFYTQERRRLHEETAGRRGDTSFDRVRTVYLGTSPFAVAVLERLAASDHRPQLVVTRPDRPRGRGRRLSAPPVADAARALGIEVIQPDSVNTEEARGAIAAARPDGVAICAFGALIREPLLSEHPMWNVHPSLLPRWRGAAPIERAIEAGDSVTGVTIMRPTAELDAGPMCLQAEERIRPDDDYGTLTERLQSLGGELLVRSLDEMPPFEEQPTEGVTYAEKIGPDDRRLNPATDAARLERRVRALNPHVGAFIEDPRLGVRRALAVADDVSPGTLRAVDGRLLFGTASGALELLEVVPPGSRAMDAAAYLRGHGLP